MRRMTMNVPENDLTDEVLEDAPISPAAEALRPEGLSDREWALVRRDRAEQAAEARRVAAWGPVIDELDEAAGDEGNPRAALFIKRSSAHGWEADDEVESFAFELMRERGYVETQIRGHGLVWEKED
jgi:hypothetical protein